MSVSHGGVPKRALLFAPVSKAGLEGDSWADLRFHGGPDQAVLVIANEALDQLKLRGFPVFPGALGENITTRGSHPGEWRIGQIWRAGTARIQFTKLRTPCSKIRIYGAGIGRAIYDARTQSGDPGSPVWGWGGMYGRVLAPGVVVPGDEFRLEGENA